MVSEAVRSGPAGLTLIAAAWITLAGAPAHADANERASQEAPPAATAAGPRLRWQPEWPKFRPAGYALTAASVLGAIGVSLWVNYPDNPRWHGGILFDDAARDLLRARNPSARDATRRASDFTLVWNLVQVGVVDSVLLPLLDRSPRVLAQLTLINAQALALNTLLATLLFKAIARERPLGRDCVSNSEFDPLCRVGTYASFPSSHSSTAFTAAGLTCVHHQYLPLYGGGWGDTAACVQALTVAGATGLFRIIGDRHYVTDVVIGALMGLSLGYVYPWLLHYRSKPQPLAADTGSSEQSSVRWTVLPAPPSGLLVSGTF